MIKSALQYQIISRIGQGSFSEIFLVHSKAQNKDFAMKVLNQPFRSIEEVRTSPEISALLLFKNYPYIVQIVDLLYDNHTGKVAIILELLQKNLNEFSDFQIPEKKCILIIYQLLKAISFMHSNYFFHRDIKPENIMIDPNTYEIKLVDFGSSKKLASKGPYTEYICTRWYRAPECILTSGSYGSSVDIWATGCIFYEILTGNPLFPGNNEIDQLHKIHSTVGTPDEQLLQRLKSNPNTQLNFTFPFKPKTEFKTLLPGINLLIPDLLEKLLTYNPYERISAEQALNHPLFKELRDLDQLFSKTPNSMTFSQYCLQAEIKLPQIPIAALPQNWQITQLSTNYTTRTTIKIFDTNKKRKL